MTITDQIIDLINQYQETEQDAVNLGTLMEIRKQLAVKGLHLGKHTAKFKRELDGLTAQRKIQFFKIKLANLPEGVGAAETIAETQISDLRGDESAASGNYHGSKIILDQLNEVLDSLKQDIAQLRQEERGSQ